MRKSKKADIKEELDHLLDLPPNLQDYTYDQAIALARMALALDPENKEFQLYLKDFLKKNDPGNNGS